MPMNDLEWSNKNNAPDKNRLIDINVRGNGTQSFEIRVTNFHACLWQSRHFHPTFISHNHFILRFHNSQMASDEWNIINMYEPRGKQHHIMFFTEKNVFWWLNEKWKCLRECDETNSVMRSKFSGELNSNTCLLLMSDFHPCELNKCNGKLYHITLHSVQVTTSESRRNCKEI